MKKLPPIAAKLIAQRASGAGNEVLSRLGGMSHSVGLVVLVVFLAVGLLMSVLDLLAQPAAERAYAKRHVQRVVFAASGEQSMNMLPKKPRADDFDVDESPEERQIKKAVQSAEKKTLETGEAPAIEASSADIAPPDIAEEPTATAPQEQAPVPEVAPVIDVSLTPLVTKPAVDMVNVKRSAKSLIFAPAPEISKPTKHGLLPILGKHDAKASHVYARTFRPTDDTPMIAVVVTGLGFHAGSLNQALALPADVTLSVSPYAPALGAVIDSARNAGHEIWFDLPVQTERYPAEDPGPLSIVVTLNYSERATRLEKLMIATRGAVGAIFPPAETLSKYEEIFLGVVETFTEHGLHLFYTDEDAPMVDEEPLRHADYIILKSSSPSKLTSEFSSLASTLKATENSVIIMVQASATTLRALADFIPKLKKLPVTLAPLSAFYLDFEALKAAEEKAAQDAANDAKKSGGGH